MSEELIRVAILWHEQWHESLEEASRLYFGERDVRAMLATLEPLHAMLERGPQTSKEISFSQVRRLLRGRVRLDKTQRRLWRPVRLDDAIVLAGSYAIRIYLKTVGGSRGVVDTSCLCQVSRHKINGSKRTNKISQSRSGKRQII